MHARHEAKFTVSHFKNTLAGLWSEKERWESTPSERNVAVREKRKKSCDARSLWPIVGEGQRGKKRRKGKNDEDERNAQSSPWKRAGLRRSNNGGGNRRKELVWRGRKKSAW